MFSLEIKKQRHVFDHPVIMGILNLTPDSFSDGGCFNDMDAALRHCEDMLLAGADMIDIGGCSTRPNNPIATEREELDRLLPIVKAIRKRFPEALLSIDTFRATVAESCVAEGADIINDISGGLFDEGMLPYIGTNHIPYILMHCVGTPETIHNNALDGDIHQTVMDFFEQQFKKLQPYGPQQVILDPGIGFGKSIPANYRLLKQLDRYRLNGFPILIGISRKSLIFKTLQTTPQEAENGTTVLNTIALLNGADILRVHDVQKAKEAVMLCEKFFEAGY